MNNILSIGITSYKRIKELERCLKSIQTEYVDDIEIIVSEDHSPLYKEIGELVERLAKKSKYRLLFLNNEINLGYDMNLGSIIQKCSGEYIFLLSDDDMVEEKSLDKLIPLLKENRPEGVIYAPFIYNHNGEWDRYRGDNIKSIKGEKSAAEYLYDSILFSGLIFKKKYVEKIDASRFKNYNYFQVYLFLEMIYKYGGLYIPFPTIRCIGDGENAYGLSESSGGNEKLANRKSVKSNLEFNKTLIKIIRVFDNDEGTNVFKSFEKQYSLHSYTGLSIARNESVKYFKEYWNVLNSLDLYIYPIAKIYYIILLLLGKKKADRLLSGFRKLVKRRKNNG